MPRVPRGRALHRSPYPAEPARHRRLRPLRVRQVRARGTRRADELVQLPCGVSRIDGRTHGHEGRLPSVVCPPGAGAKDAPDLAGVRGTGWSRTPARARKWTWRSTLARLARRARLGTARRRARLSLVKGRSGRQVQVKLREHVRRRTVRSCSAPRLGPDGPDISAAGACEAAQGHVVDLTRAREAPGRDRLGRVRRAAGTAAAFR